jgi:PAS domain S-box-containing protein
MRSQAEQDQFELLSLTKPSILSRINKLKIAPRLFVCFALIVLLMLVGNSLLVWQFNLVRQQSNRVSALARELAVVSRFQTDVLSFDARLDSLAKSENIDGLKQEVGHLRSVLFTDTEAVKDALIHLPSDVPRDTAILPTVQAVEITLPPQLDAVIALGVASDWNAARVRLANEKKPLEASASNLVRNVEQQVTDQLSHSVAQAQRVQSQILLILPLTALVTLLVAVLLGFAITQSISASLRKLLQASTALARGDFDHQVQLSGNDELAHLGTVFNETTAKLRALYRQIQSSEAHLAEAQRVAHMGSWVWRVAGRDALHLSEEWYRIYGFDPKLGMPEWKERLQRVHPEDRGTWQGTIERAIQERSDYEVEFRILLPDGTIKWVQTVGHPVLSTAGELVEFIGISMDLTERKHMEEELQQLVDFVRHIITVLSPNGKITYANRVAREYTGLTLDEYRLVDVLARVIHPDDIERMRAVRERGLSANNPFEIEARTVGKDGVCRWFLYRYNPLRDENREITRWYVTGTDIEDRKRAEDRLQHENVALREEIDRASMFEEIVGTSKPLKAVLSQTAKVARTDATVLITGETGTGKELIARAVHKRSERSEHAFISVNCAAFAPTLISSELFGHEKGAFTGATQRRIGRFELADGGTIFLDEVGDLPPDTQIALLRVLQEREFERVGGAQPIKVNVRVIAATNRDLDAAVASGSFRSDLFYRLQVFPIEIPPLRERREDIALLVEYFIDRYSRKARKNIRHVSQETLELLQSYAWPGNIRELQNVIERSVILCETEIFSIDESWLPKQPSLAEPKSQMELPERLLAQEKEMIEAALKESRGRIFGPTGAAAKLGIPRSTLESKIRSLKINKNHFRISPET